MSKICSPLRNRVKQDLLHFVYLLWLLYSWCIMCVFDFHILMPLYYIFIILTSYRVVFYPSNYLLHVNKDENEDYRHTLHIRLMSWTFFKSKLWFEITTSPMRERTAYTTGATQLPVMSFKHNLRTTSKIIIDIIINNDSLFSMYIDSMLVCECDITNHNINKKY